MSNLAYLQKFVADKFKCAADFSFAQISTFGFSRSEEFCAASGIQISVGAPIPVKVSKYSAKAIFAEVEFTVEVVRKNIDASAPSALDVCEAVSASLNFWIPPSESGYGKIFLAEKFPWKIEKCDANECLVSIKFRSQSLIK